MIPLTTAVDDSSSFMRVASPSDDPLVVPVLTGRLQLDVLNLLLAAPEFAPWKAEEGAKDESSLRQLGYVPCCDHPKVPGHIYHEGYFHSIPAKGNDPALLRNARNGMLQPTPAAPLALRAFLAAFRELNSAPLAELIEALGLQELSPTVDHLFSDIASQSHFGDAIAISIPGSRGWHYDGPNSSLHLSITLSGTRCLKLVRAEEKDPSEVTCFQISSGDVYLTSPTLFMHAVEYPACSHVGSDRVLALQCRIACLGESRFSRVSHSDQCHVLFAILQDKPFVLPQLADVQRHMSIALEHEKACAQ